MKKFVFMIALVVLVMAACGDAEEGHYIVEEDEYIVEEYIEESHVAQVFLEDLDYMLYVLENNFALFDVAYWARGVDIHAIVESIRAEILANPNMNADEFYHALAWYFSPLGAMPTAHFNILTPLRHHYITTNHQPNRGNSILFSDFNVLEFYEQRHPDGETTYYSPEASAAQLAKMTDEAANLFIDWITLFGEAELAEEILQARRDGDFEAASALIDAGLEIIQNTPNIATEIIAESSVAYLSINSFMTPLELWSYEESKIFDFYEEIRDFDHLIIDLRRNRGGFTTYFPQIVMGPNIDTAMQAHGYVFLRYGSYAADFAASISNLPVSGANSLDRGLRPIVEMLEEFDIPELNLDDMERMDYGFRVQLSYQPRRVVRFDFEPAFSGQIWLLTSQQTGSAAQIATWIAKESGFATLVGDVTGGNYGGQRTFVALPNSGIAFQMDLFYVTDRYGRPLEAGTIPHYFNRPGMDALETVLAMIEEADADSFAEIHILWDDGNMQYGSRTRGNNLALYAIENDGTDITQIAAFGPLSVEWGREETERCRPSSIMFFDVMDEWIILSVGEIQGSGGFFFGDLYRVRRDGNGRETFEFLDSNPENPRFIVINDWIYYQDWGCPQCGGCGYGWIRFRADGTEKELLDDIISAIYFFGEDGYIYGTHHAEEMTGSWRRPVNLVRWRPEHINEAITLFEGSSLPKCEYSDSIGFRDIVVADGYVMLTAIVWGYRPGDGWRGSLIYSANYRVDVDGSNLKLLNEEFN